MNTTELIAEQLGAKIGLSRNFSRSKFNTIFVNCILILMIILIATPIQQLRACACSEIAIGQSTMSSSMLVDEMGELQLTQSDISLDGVVSIDLTRMYQSHNFSTGIFGMGWSAGLVSYMLTTTGDLKINFSGNISTFNASDSYFNAHKDMQASFTATNEVTVKNNFGERWIFDTTNGTLKEYDDRNGNAVTFTWNIVNTTFLGSAVKVYCPLTMTFPGGRTIAFTYSTTAGMEHLCIQATSPSGFTVNYGYTQNLLTSITKSNGQSLAYTYHTIVDSSHSDWVQGWLTKVTYADASEVSIAYNELYTGGNSLAVTSVSGPNGYEHTYSYSSNPTTVTMTDSLGHAGTSVYTDSGNTVKVTDALGNYSESYANSDRSVTEYINPRGKITTYTYDTTNVDVLAHGNRLSLTNPLGKTWNYTYDSNNFLNKITDPLNHDRQMTYDSKGNILTRKNGLNQITWTNTYTTGGLLSTSKNGVNDVISYSYNSFGLLSKKTDAAGKEWKYSYSSDNAGNLTKITNPLNHDYTVEYNGFYKISKATDALGHETLFEYDDMANLTEITDANNNVTEVYWDSLQRNTGFKNALNYTSNFSYDAESNLTILTDALTHAYTYTYDAINEPTKLTFPDGSHQDTAYDSDGHITKFTNRASQETDIAYDNGDRQSSKTWIGTTNTTFTYSYDDAGNPTDYLKTAGSTTLSNINYSYNSADELVAVTAEGKSIGYEYDVAERLTKITYPSTDVVNYVFNNRDLLSSIKDAANIDIASYTYDDAGNLTKRTTANGLECVCTYNNANWINNIVLRQTSAPTNILQSFEYGYDNIGNRVYVKYENGSGDVFQYDTINQLTGVKYGVSNPTAGYNSATGASRVVTYAYDAVGNRTQVIDGATTINYTVNNLNQYTAVGANSSFIYDGNGNLQQDGTWTYSYDYENHLIGAVKTGVSITYKYDAIGRRIDKNINGAVTKYVYSGDNLIEERNSSDAVLAKYIYNEGIDRPVKVVKGGNTYYFQQDFLGNITALTDSSGSIFESYSYDVYGHPTIRDSGSNIITTPTTPFLFTGREYDSETGLYHFRTRAYSPDLGRFCQADMLGIRKEEANLYRYVHNNPVNMIDPMGTCAQVLVLIVGEAIVITGLFFITYQLTKKTTFHWDPVKCACMSLVENLRKEISRKCAACIPPAGSIGYKYHTTHSHHPVDGPHVHLFTMNQDPVSCECYWNRSGTTKPPPPPGAIPL